MVTKRLVELQSIDWHHATALKKEMKALKMEKLHKMNMSQVEQLCRKVINAVEMNILVSVDEKTLENRKLKKDRKKPLEYTEHETNTNGVNIRNDWATHQWTDRNPPHGWVYHDTNWSVIGTIYETKEEKWYSLFIQREIADNPHGAFLLIKEMKENLERLMRNKQKIPSQKK